MSKLARDFLKGKGVNFAYSKPLGNEYDETYMDPEEPMRVYMAKKAAEESKKSETPKAPRRSVPPKKQETPKNPEIEEPSDYAQPRKTPRVPRQKAAPRGPKYHESDYISNVILIMEIPDVPVIVGPPEKKSHFLIHPETMDLFYRTWQPKTKDFKTTAMILGKTKQKAFSNPKMEAVKLGIFVHEEDLPENLRQQYQDQKAT